MDTNSILNEILKLRQHSPDKVGEYLFSTFSNAGLNVQKQVFFFSTKTDVLVGFIMFLLCALLLAAALKRKSLLVIGAAFAIPLILFLEFSLDIPVVSWPVLKKSENVVVQFPVQNATEKVIIGTPYADIRERKQEPTRFEATISAFLLPIALAISALGLWQLVVHFGKVNSEDIRTIIVVTALISTVYFGIWTGTAIRKSGAANIQDPGYNGDSVAMLTTLAMQRKDERLENTWATVAFFGGPGGQGLERFERQLSQGRGNRIQTVLIECREIGREGDLAFVVPLEESEDSVVTLPWLVNLLTSSTLAVSGRSPKVFLEEPSEDEGIAKRRFSSIMLTSVSAGEESADSDRAGTYEVEYEQVEQVQQVLENMLLQVDAEQIRRRLPAPPERGRPAVRKK
jgi:hypothetical protein